MISISDGSISLGDLFEGRSQLMLLVEDGVQVDDTAIATQEGTLHTLLLLPVYTYWGVKVNVVMDRK